MAETVRISRGAKQLLEELRARLLLEAGVRVTLQELVDAAVALAAARSEELLEILGGRKRRLSPEEAERLLDELSFDGGPEDVEEDLERTLYAGGTG